MCGDLESREVDMFFRSLDLRRAPYHVRGLLYIFTRV
jgi:hypothetical protein